MSILDRRFKYVPAVATDVRKTIRREQERLKALAERDKANEAEASAKVEPLPQRKRASR